MIRNSFKTIIIIIGLVVYLYLFIVGINTSKQIETLQFEKQHLNKENDISTNKILQFIDENKSLNQTIYSLQYTIDEFRKNFAKTEIQFENELDQIKSQLSQCNNESKINKDQLIIIKNKYDILLKDNKNNNSINNNNNKLNNNNSKNSTSNNNNNSNQNNKLNSNIIDKPLDNSNNNKMNSIEFKILKSEIIPIVIPTCERIEYLERTLNSLIMYRKDKLKFPIIISQDCNSREMYSYLESLSIGDEIITIRSPNRTKVPAYESISRHYKWFLTQMFDKFSYDKVIIVEDDLLVSPDFYEYFETMSTLLDIDESIFCISAWNDNGKKKFLNQDLNQSKLTFHRTDFFPGLGWMLKNKFWKEIKSDWPVEYWDDYLRRKEVFKGRQCIRPELPRVKNIGESGGATNSLVFEFYIKNLIYNQDSNVDYQSYNIYQLLEPYYSNQLRDKVENAQVAQFWEIDSFNYINKTIRVIFKGIGDYNVIATQLKLADDNRDQIQRTSYKKIVQFYYKSNLIFLTPKDIEW